MKPNAELNSHAVLFTYKIMQYVLDNLEERWRDEQGTFAGSLTKIDAPLADSCSRLWTECYDTLAEMEELHVQHMDEPGPTDVLSFEMDELRVPAEGEIAEPGILGDVVLCPDFAAKQAAENNQDTASELDLLLVHGILHLLGHDHAEPEEHKVMFGLQGDILATLNKTRGA